MNTNDNDLGLDAPETKSYAPSPSKVARELAALNALADQLNIAAEVPSNSIPKMETRDFTPTRAPELPTKPLVVKTPPFNPELIFYTGRLKAGKDFVAAQTGATIFGFAEPLYAMRAHFFGEVDKDKHGARELLQIMGQWGRGTVSDKYPLTPARASFVKMVRECGQAGDFGDFGVDWENFGRSEDLWLAAMLHRVTEFKEHPENANKRVACVNVRFKNEHARLTAAGWTHFHVMCSPSTWEDRLRSAGIDPKSPALTDVSEQMAINLDKQAIDIAMRRPNTKLRCVWSDDTTPPNYPGAFHTVASFLADLATLS